MNSIIQSEANDISTNKVISWLNYFGESIRRINSKPIHEFTINISDNNTKIIIDEDIFIDKSFSKCKYWYRRGGIYLAPSFFPKVQKVINTYLIQSWMLIYELFDNRLNDKNTLGNFIKEINDNPLIDICIARESGFKVPDTLITSSKSTLNRFLKEKGRIITKNIKLFPWVSSSSHHFDIKGTKEVLAENLDILEDHFFPSLFQENVEKLIELRIFFFDKNFFPMAIFSQLDDETKIDYRNYNNKKPNRNIPYKLPKDIEEKLEAFMQKSELDTGSIDMIVTPNNEYVFLEVNPSGQFDWLSVNCNYYVEEKIAQYLGSIKE